MAIVRSHALNSNKLCHILAVQSWNRVTESQQPQYRIDWLPYGRSETVKFVARHTDSRSVKDLQVPGGMFSYAPSLLHLQ